ncbi:MAG TPA: biosynthetic arginine decarboxylase, partial [Longimicrobium sp.]|nr:biosynthetic arginine decarboxylase [Longimicrobium sp.]
PHPNLVSESGRAVVAHHAVLVVDVLGTSEFDPVSVPEKTDDKAPSVVRNLLSTFREVTNKNLLEAYHDAQDYKEETLTLFSLGHLSLEQRVAAENIFWALCQKIMRIARESGEIPEELEALEKQLSDTYFCNFSVFQSLPDSWAIDQLFPIMPIHRLDEEPTRRGTLQDMTCDSDGKIDHFTGWKRAKPSLELHAFRHGETYILGIFLTGAYQEILGDLHNLFGDTNAVHVRLSDTGYEIEDLVHGDTVTEVLNYVQFNAQNLTATFRRKVQNARLKRTEANTFIADYVAGLEGYTYLEE